MEKQLSEPILATISPLTFEASVHAARSSEAAQRETTQVLRVQMQQVEYEAARAFAQYDQAAPKNRLVTSQLESRGHANWEELAPLQEPWHTLQEAMTPLSEADRQMIMALGRHVRALGFSDDGALALKKQIIRLLIWESMVSLDDATQVFTCMLHWQGGCHTPMSMKKPLSGAIKSQTPAPAIALIRHLSVRCDDGAIARVLSQLGRTTARGQRWNQTRVADTRKQYGIAAVDKAHLDPNILRLGQAVQYTGGSDTTRMTRMHKAILPYHQVAPSAPLAIHKSDLDSHPVRSILEHLKATGVLVLAGVSLPRQALLFQ